MKTNTLGELEQQIMDIVWRKQKSSIRDIVNELKQNREIAYTTVATVLQRLFDKGIVDRKEEKAGHMYFSTTSKESYIKGLAQNFMNKLMTSFGDVAIASFAESIEELPKEKRTQLLKLLDEYEKDK